MLRATILLVLAGSALTSCEADRPATWSYIHEAIIEPNCTSSACHSKISSAFGIELHDREGAYVFLTGAVCGQELEAQAPRNFVSPGDPTGSKLLYLLRGEEVRNMPPDVPLPDADIDLIEQWILEGASCD